MSREVLEEICKEVDIKLVEYKDVKHVKDILDKLDISEKNPLYDIYESFTADYLGLRRDYVNSRELLISKVKKPIDWSLGAKGFCFGAIFGGVYGYILGGGPGKMSLWFALIGSQIGFILDFINYVEKRDIENRGGLESELEFLEEKHEMQKDTLIEGAVRDIKKYR